MSSYVLGFQDIDKTKLMAVGGKPLRERIRQRPGCAMMFVNTLRPGKQRWRSSAHNCGAGGKFRNLRDEGAQEKQEK